MRQGTIPDERWNHNIHYHGVVLDAVSPTATRSALDVGCGEGLLCRRLSRLGVPTVIGIDSDRLSIDLARRQDPNGDSGFRCEDFLTARLPEASFDLVASVATLHHLDVNAALLRMADLLRPGGRLVVIGLARSVFPHDVPRELAALVVSRLIRLRHEKWDHPSPTVWPPPHSFPEVRRLAERALPGVRFRRHLLWRYSLTWTKPSAFEPGPDDVTAMVSSRTRRALPRRRPGFRGHPRR